MSAEYDDAAAIGKRYRRQDEIGTPWALTIDEQTLADGTVTLRDRDTLSQERIPLDGAQALLLDRLDEPWRPRPELIGLSWTRTRSPPRRCAATRSATRTNVPCGSGRREDDVRRYPAVYVIQGRPGMATPGSTSSPGRRRTQGSTRLAPKPSSSSSMPSPPSAGRSTSTRPGSATTTPISATSSSLVDARVPDAARASTAAFRESRPAATAR